MTEIFNTMNTQMANLPNPVQMWMNWMMFIFLCSILFVWNYKTARWVFASFWLSMPLAIFVYYLTNTIHLLGIVHIIIWLPLLIFLYRADFKSESFKKISPYGIWVILLATTIVISLIFDVRDIVLVSTGKKWNPSSPPFSFYSQPAPTPIWQCVPPELISRHPHTLEVASEEARFFGGTLEANYTPLRNTHTWSVAITSGRPFLTR